MVKTLLRWFWPVKADPLDRCVRCRRLTPISMMRESGQDDWICRDCSRKDA